MPEDFEGLRRPRALRRGDRVAVLTASSPTNLERLEVGLDTLRFAGFEPVVYESARSRGDFRHHLAGTDAMRAADLRAALLDDSIAGILTAGGGYGSQRTLERLDWTGLDAVEPKVVAGYSDVTAVLEALAVKLGWASLMGPMVAEGEFAESYSFGSLLRCLTAPETVTLMRFDDGVTVVGGTACGVTAGGNLSLIAGSVGTPTSRPADGAIVLFEDEQEDDSRIDTMLTHLRRSGYLDGVRGVICGTWNNCGTVEQVHPVLADRLGDLGVPLLAWANLGHGGHVQTFPIGVCAELDADARTLRLLEPPLLPSATA